MAQNWDENASCRNFSDTLKYYLDQSIDLQKSLDAFQASLPAHCGVKVKDPSLINDQIGWVEIQLEEALKVQHALLCSVKPHFLAANQDGYGISDMILFLENTLCRLTQALYDSLHYLRDDLKSKNVELEKRREKRKRHKENKRRRDYFSELPLTMNF